MALPLFSYPLSSQNQRVTAYEIPGDECPRRYSTSNLSNGMEIDEIIWAAYRQIFNEQQILASNRQIALESQLRSKQIRVREFIRGLVLSDSFRRFNYESNNNYRFVEICIQRLLGRNVYDNREKLAWSTVLATQGLKEFVNQLLNSEEYFDNFGDDTVPYQRRRILQQRSQGELPFARMARYDEYHLKNLRQMGLFQQGLFDHSVAVYRRVILAVPIFAVILLVLTSLIVFDSYL